MQRMQWLLEKERVLKNQSSSVLYYSNVLVATHLRRKDLWKLGVKLLKISKFNLQNKHRLHQRSWLIKHTEFICSQEPPTVLQQVLGKKKTDRSLKKVHTSISTTLETNIKPLYTTLFVQTLLQYTHNEDVISWGTYCGCCQWILLGS